VDIKIKLPLIKHDAFGLTWVNAAKYKSFFKDECLKPILAYVTI